MPASSTVALFLLAAAVLLITPGPAVVYIVTRSMAQGRRAGLASVVGVQLASLTHVTAATLGLSALLMASALAFSTVKYLGAKRDARFRRVRRYATGTVYIGLGMTAAFAGPAKK